MGNVSKYINAISDLYNLKEAARETLIAGSEQISDVIDKYSWDNVDSAISYFYTHISDKSRPKISQIRAILLDWERMQRISPIEPEPDVASEPSYRLPTTKIWSINHTFAKMIEIMVKCKILEPENESDRPAGAGCSLIDPKTDQPLLCPRQWIKQQVQSAIETRPDIYRQFAHLSLWEAFALGLQNKLIKIQVRDWHKCSERLKAVLE